MKRTIGKIGLGLAGAVAAVGLMSAGVQTADAQLELLPAPPGGSGVANPAVSPIVSGTYAGDYSYSYYVGVQWTGSSSYSLQLSNSTANPNYFSLAFNDYVSSSGYTNTPTTFATNFFSPAATNNVATQNDWTPSYNNGVITLTFTGANPITVTSSTSGPAGTYESVAALGEFTFISSIGPGSTPEKLFNSSIDEVTNTGSFYTIVTQGTNAIGPALPLPAAFWPGLLTLGGMAVVGGLRMRRRTV
ncbi:MAG: hypothetical protein ACYCUV_13370 [Phycisphaerae bacterium]